MRGAAGVGVGVAVGVRVGVRVGEHDATLTSTARRYAHHTFTQHRHQQYHPVLSPLKFPPLTSTACQYAHHTPSPTSTPLSPTTPHQHRVSVCPARPLPLPPRLLDGLCRHLVVVLVLELKRSRLRILGGGARGKRSVTRSTYMTWPIPRRHRSHMCSATR